MQAFMQSLQMRWPVAASIGLSTAMMPLAASLHHVELGDLLLERAAGQRDAEHGVAEAIGGRLFLEALRARVFSLLVAPDAVVRLVERADQVGAAIGQLES